MATDGKPRHWSDKIGDGIDKADFIVTKVMWLACTVLAVSCVIAMIRAVWR